MWLSDLSESSFKSVLIRLLGRFDPSAIFIHPLEELRRRRIVNRWRSYNDRRRRGRYKNIQIYRYCGGAGGYADDRHCYCYHSHHRIFSLSGNSWQSPKSPMQRIDLRRCGAYCESFFQCFLVALGRRLHGFLVGNLLCNVKLDGLRHLGVNSLHAIELL